MASQTPFSSDRSDIPAPDPAHPGRSRFFAWLRGLGITRSPGWIGGVATGIADRLGIDPLIVRGILVVAAVIGAPATLLYAIAWLLLPDTKGKIHFEELLAGRVDSPIIGIGVLLAISLLPVTQGIWSLGAAYWGQPYWGDSIGRAVWTLVILGLIAWLVVWFVRRGKGTVGTTADAGSSRPDARADAATTVTVASATDTMSATPTTSTTSDTPTTSAIPTAPIAAPVAPPRPSPEASTEDVAAWRDRQAQWKLQYDAYRLQQSAERQAAVREASAAARSERAARNAVYREARARTRSNPLYSLALIGLAIVGGALTTLVIGNAQPTTLEFLTGIAVAIGILAIGIILNGVRGRRAGGASAVAVLLAIPLLFAWIFPQSDTLHYSGAWNLTPSLSNDGTDQRFVEGFGPVTLDLRDYYAGNTAATSSSSVDLIVASGNVIVLLPPTDATDAASITVRTGRGSISTDTGVHLTGNQPHSWGMSSSISSGQTLDNSLGVSITAASGNITVVNAPTN